MIKCPRGSEWRKWDLHFHTPASYDYGDKSVTNDDIINTLHVNGISVVAITDHHVIDTEKIKDLQEKGKTKGVTVLPGIEFLSDARGSEPVHFIGIFSEESDIDYIWEQIKNGTAIKEVRGKGKKEKEVYCDLLDTVRLVKELGGIITIHAGQKSGSVECITNSLPHAMAQKADIAQNVDVFELGKTEDQTGYASAVFPCIKKILPMIICSDNHNVRKYVLKANCWIKADPTFDGLRQIIFEPEDRVYIGDSPEVLERVRTNKTKYIKSLKIDPISGYDDKKGVWFKDVKIEFNKELVAVIGNKGNGKSAIADILGLLGNTRNYENFSFLDKNRFHKEGLSKNFEGFLEWENLTVDGRILYDGVVGSTSPEKVRYLPQDFFNKLTNDLSGKNFKSTLENVIFQHLDPSLKMGKDTFEELKELKTQTIKEEIEKKKAELADLNSRIVKLERKQLPEYLDRIDNAIKQKETELQEKEKLLEELRAKEVKNPNEDEESKRLKSESFRKIEELNSLLSEINNLIDEKRELKGRLEIEKESLTVFLANFEGLENKFSQYKDANREKLLEFGIKVDEVIKLTINNQPLKDKLQIVNSELEKIRKLFLTKEDISLIDRQLVPQLESESLAVRKENCLNDIEVIKKDLSKHEKEYQEYLEQKNIIEKSLQDIRGSSDKTETLEYYKNLKKYVSEGLPLDLRALEDQRLSVALSIFSEKKKIIDLFNSFKNPIDRKVEANKAYLDDDYAINIDAKLDFDSSIDRRFLGYVNQAKKGSFCGLSEGTTVLWNIYLGTNPHVDDSIKEMLIGFLDHIRFDKRDGLENEPRNIFDQVADVEAFYNYIYSLDYLKPEYELKSGEKSLEELSPGEKGTLLLIFYLMIDEEGIPLIIDQPEDNLDNQSVFKMLTRFIKIAKKQRQIVIVTHNPNLAIGADAEQIIYVKIDKKGNNVFSFKSGSIEDPEINKITVDILEGTMPAFDKRRLKYIKC